MAASGLTFEEFASAHLDALLRFATALTNDRELGPDLVQDALLRAYERWAHVGSRMDPVPYARRFRSHRWWSTAGRRCGRRLRADCSSRFRPTGDSRSDSRRCRRLQSSPNLTCWQSRAACGSRRTWPTDRPGSTPPSRCRTSPQPSRNAMPTDDGAVSRKPCFAYKRRPGGSASKLT